MKEQKIPWRRHTHFTCVVRSFIKTILHSIKSGSQSSNFNQLDTHTHRHIQAQLRARIRRGGGVEKWSTPKHWVPCTKRYRGAQVLILVVADTQTSMLPGIPGSAICVQEFDDSLNSAIHITYRISLRSSSLREPRYPLLKVVFFLFVRNPVQVQNSFFIRITNHVFNLELKIGYSPLVTQRETERYESTRGFRASRMNIEGIKFAHHNGVNTSTKTLFEGASDKSHVLVIQDRYWVQQSF